MAENHYRTLSDTELLHLPVHTLAATNCALLLWTTGPKTAMATKLLQRWGFTYKTIFLTWVKTTQEGDRPVCVAA